MCHHMAESYIQSAQKKLPTDLLFSELISPKVTDTNTDPLLFRIDLVTVTYTYPFPAP